MSSQVETRGYKMSRGTEGTSPKTEKTPLNEVAENIRSIVKISVGHMGDYFPGGIHHPDLIWKETGRRVTEVNQNAHFRALLSRDNDRAAVEGRTAQIVTAVDKRGNIVILEAFDDQRNGYGELDLNSAISRAASDEEVIHWVLPLMTTVESRVASDRFKSIWYDLDQISKGTMPKKDSIRTRELSRQLTSITDAKDTIILELTKLTGSHVNSVGPSTSHTS
jgi:hypothetical protein